jgi:hypothetical protein
MAGYISNVSKRDQLHCQVRFFCRVARQKDCPALVLKARIVYSQFKHFEDFKAEGELSLRVVFSGVRRQE